MKWTILFVLLCAPLHAEPRHHFYKSAHFWIPFTIGVASMLADYQTSQEAFARGAHETDPIFGSQRPSMGRMTAIGLPIEFLFSYSGYRLSESKHGIIHDAWPAPEGAQIFDHVKLAIHNERTN